MPKEIKISIDDVLQKERELAELKQQAVEQLLAERKAIDEKLARLGYTEDRAVAKPSKKRHRRTKAELEAARATDEA